MSEWSWKESVRKERAIFAALAASALAHALALSVTFVPVPKPEAFQERTLTAVLVNVSTPKAPAKSKKIAQANLEGGGETEEESDPSSPLERSRNPKVALGEKKLAQEEMEKARKIEQEIASLLKTAKRSDWSVPVGERQQEEQSAAEAKAMLDLAAKIERDIVAYAQRPKKVFLGASARESDAALWVEAWQRKVEMMGNRFYPEAARGRIRGALILTAGVHKDGSIESATIDKSSGQRILDEAALRILRLSGPFEPFDARLRKKADILYITRQWQFGADGIVRMSAPIASEI